MTAPTPEYKARVKRQHGMSDARYRAFIDGGGQPFPGAPYPEDTGFGRPSAYNPAPVAAPPLVLTDPPQEGPRTTLRRMKDVLLGRATEPVVPSASAAFDGAVLDFGGPLPGDEAPVWPRNPVPSGSEPTRRQGGSRARARGADDLTPLFAGGLVILITFTIGEWAAPTKEEADAIAQPLSNILARRIDLAAKLGKDASDTIALAVALMAYTVRIVPLATERVRINLDERRAHRVRSDGTASASNGGASLGMASGPADEQGTGGYPSYNPRDAIAQARANGHKLFNGDDAVVGIDRSALGDRG